MNKPLEKLSTMKNRKKTSVKTLQNDEDLLKDKLKEKLLDHEGRSGVRN